MFFKCPSCGGNKFHVVHYHQIVNGQLRVMEDESEMRCVYCHHIMNVRDVVKRDDFEKVSDER